MQITENTTGMLAGIAPWTDKEGRDFVVVVVKGTFDILAAGGTRLAEEQEPFTYADAHHGDPGTTSIKYECDFAPMKPRADVILNAHAYSPSGEPVRSLLVGLSVNDFNKVIKVTGDRVWESGALGLHPSEPKNFIRMPLLFERAFGGSDHTHPDERKWRSDSRNLVGVGFHSNGNSRAVVGTPLPNLEHPGHLLQKWSDVPAPIGLSAIGRNWQPRLKFAGTYDERWIKERFPFLPEDFDAQYFLAAPTDQQFPSLLGGEVIRCVNMTPEGTLGFAVPVIKVVCFFRFRDHSASAPSSLDTLIVEPDRHRFIALWRAMAPLGRKPSALREVIVRSGTSSPPEAPRSTEKPHFHSLGEAVEWARSRRGPGS